MTSSIWRRNHQISCHGSDFFLRSQLAGHTKKLRPESMEISQFSWWIHNEWLLPTPTKCLTSWMSEYLFSMMVNSYKHLGHIYIYIYTYVTHLQSSASYGASFPMSKPRPSHVRPLRGITWKQGGAWDFLQGNKDGKITNKNGIDIYSIIYSCT